MNIKISVGDKTITFLSKRDIDHFTGATLPYIEHRQLNPSLYVEMCHKRGCPILWDDDSEMSPEDWVSVVRTIYTLE